MKGHLFKFAWIAALVGVCAIPYLQTPNMSTQAHADTGVDPIPEAEYTAFHQDVFNSLFGESWDPDNWTYALIEPVYSDGRYAGENHLGQEFLLSVFTYLPVSIDELELSPQEEQVVLDEDYTFAFVYATLSTDSATVHLSGIVASRVDPEDGRVWTFMPIWYANPDGPMFIDPTIYPDQGTIPEDEGTIELQAGLANVDAIAEDLDVVIDTTCEELAVEDYEEDVADCNNIYNTAVAGCNNVYTTTVIGCNATYNAAVNGAKNVSTPVWRWHMLLKLPAVSGASPLQVAGDHSFVFLHVGRPRGPRLQLVKPITTVQLPLQELREALVSTPQKLLGTLAKTMRRQRMRSA